MTSGDDIHSLDIELARVVDRLNSMPLQRAASAADACQAVAESILERTRELTDDAPPHATLPRLAPQGLGAMIAVLGRDYRNAAKAAPESDVSAVVSRLVELRRSLP